MCLALVLITTTTLSGTLAKFISSVTGTTNEVPAAQFNFNNAYLGDPIEWELTNMGASSHDGYSTKTLYPGQSGMMKFDVSFISDVKAKDVISVAEAPEKVNGEGWEGDADDEDDISVTLSRNANADISGYLLYELPTDCDKLIELHKNQKNNKGVKHNLVRNAVLSAVRKTAPLFTAEEAKITKIAEFRRLAEDQLVEGEYLTTTEVLKEKAGEDEVDSTGNELKGSKRLIGASSDTDR